MIMSNLAKALAAAILSLIVAIAAPAAQYKAALAAQDKAA